MEKKMNVLDVLLRADLPDMRKDLPEKRIEMIRLSDLAGAPVEFTLRGLTYKQVRELQDRSEDRSAYGVLYGCVDPNWKDPKLLDKEKGLVTPIDVIKAKLLPGEIEDLYIEIQLLSGYPELALLFYLFHTHNWGLMDLRSLQSCGDGWQEIIREFSAYEVNR